VVGFGVSVSKDRQNFSYVLLAPGGTAPGYSEGWTGWGRDLIRGEIRKSIPQGLKPTFIVGLLRHDSSRALSHIYVESELFSGL